MMLYPQENAFRARISLDGLWSFAVDPDGAGERKGWSLRPPAGRVVAVPGSWNEQFADLHDYHRAAWYSRSFHLPRQPGDRRVYLRLGAACHHSQVWVNGACAGAYPLGYLPAVFDITALVRPGLNLLVVRVDSILTDATLPTTGRDRGHWAGYEMAADYFPYSGLHRTVELMLVPTDGLVNLKTDTVRQGRAVALRVTAWTQGDVKRLRLTLDGGSRTAEPITCTVCEGRAEAELPVRRPTLWAPGAPHLYCLCAEALDARGRARDRYELDVGLRTVAVTADALLINGNPVVLRGFSRHEDFPIVGRGHVDAVMVRDFELMKWTGANSFRTSHYPYDERQYHMADRLGVLVIAEAPAVGLFLPKHGQKPEDMIAPGLLDLHRRALGDMVRRDWNHPSVIAWSMANECNGHTAATNAYFKMLYDFIKRLDSTRATVHTNIGGKGFDASHAHSDLVCLNHYDFACAHTGRSMAEVRTALRRRLREARRRFGKPILLSEFGICGIPGFHSLSPLYFTEEGMVDHLFAYLDAVKDLPFVVGAHVWLLQDFKAQEGPGRPTQNFKGVFDRLRQPKLAAHLLRQRWTRTPRV
jgi:beta-glucuronidase